MQKENTDALSSQRNESGREMYVSRSLSEPPKVRVRSVFTSVNASRQYSGTIGEAVDQSVSTPCRAGNSDESTSPVSMTKEDVEALLHMKMKGKGKFDFKVFFKVFQGFSWRVNSFETKRHQMASSSENDDHGF